MLTEGSALTIRGVVKNHGGLRPLRMANMAVEPGEVVSLRGLDANQAEVLVGLVTGAMLPDEGEVAVFGELTASIDSPERWLSWLDQIGLVSVRAPLLAELSVVQSIAVPLTLDLDPLAESIRRQADQLAAEVGVDAEELDRRTETVLEAARVRVHLARALALNPRILLLEHVSARLDEREARAFGKTVSRVASARRISVLALTADRPFAQALGGRRLSWSAATGHVYRSGRWARWF